MMVHANDTALENREVVFNGVAVSIATDIFARAMIDHFMTGELAAKGHVFTKAPASCLE